MRSAYLLFPLLGWVAFTGVLAMLSEPVAAAGGRTMLRIIQTQTSLARRVATEQERRTAEINARAAIVRLEAEEKRTPKAKPQRYIAVRASAGRASTPRNKPEGKRQKESSKKDTEEAPKTEAQAKKTEKPTGDDVDVMIYDRLSGGTVNKYIYTLPSEPAQKVSIKLDDYEALYVGR